MAYNHPAAVFVPSSASAGFEKASAFINLWVNTPTGRRKIGAVPLRNSKPKEAALIARLSESEDAIEKMLEVLELDFQLVSDKPVPTDSFGF